MKHKDKKKCDSAFKTGNEDTIEIQLLKCNYISYI